MRTTSTFTVSSFEPTDVTAEIATAAGAGTYLAMESFEGTLDGRAGALCIAHSATTDGGRTCSSSTTKAETTLRI
ncbi:MAG: DUF3224 domain-containing protein [Marmoricola sp.]